MSDIEIAFFLIQERVLPFLVHLGPYVNKGTNEFGYIVHGHDILFHGEKYLLEFSVAEAMVLNNGSGIVNEFVYGPHYMGPAYKKALEELLNQHKNS